MSMPKYTLLALLLFWSSIIIAQSNANSTATEDWLVLLRSESNWNSLAKTFHYQKQLSQAPNIYLVRADRATIDQLQKNSAVLAMQKDATIQWRAATPPNDPRYDSQWSLERINIEQAWEHTTGGLSPNNDEIVCAVIDGSFYVNHEDLAANIWHNTDEIPNNQIDDDQNGFVDDYTGWQTVFNTDQHDYGSISNHGTAVAGIIGAVGDNGRGVSGINQNIKMMLISAHTASEITKLSNIVEGYSYILTMRRRYNETNGQQGAFVVATNSSWGIDFAKAEDHPIWCALYDSLGAVGILSVAATTNTDNDVDRYGDMPCTCSSDYLLGVSESSVDDEQIAGYGKKSIELFAPAQSPSTRWFDNYGEFSGTSGASPHVAGAVSLLYSYPNPSWGLMIKNQPQQAALLVKSILLNSADRKEAFNASVSGGRLNLGRAMTRLAEYFSKPEANGLLHISATPIVDGQLTLRVAIQEAGSYPITIYNTAGQAIKTLQLSSDAPSTRFWHFNIKDLAKGMYVLELDINGEKHTQKFIR